jgi:signal transduction histidine kinase
MLDDTAVAKHDRPGADRILGSGLMHDMVRTFDWSATPLGCISTRSHVMVSYVNHTLNAPLPVTLTWGPDYITFYNEAAIYSLGGKHPSALGRSYRHVFGEAWDFVGREMDDCFLRGKAAVHENVLTPVIKFGQVEDHYWTYSRIPIHDCGTISGVLIPHRNTTDAVLARREHDLVATRMNQFLSVTKDSVVSVDRNWRISYMNAAAQKTYAAGRDLIGADLWTSFPDALYPGSPYIEHYERAMYHGVPGSFEAHYPAPLNIWIQLEVYATADGIVTFSRDVTEHRRAEAALIQTEKLAAVGRMASSIAHEINNPLESVTNLLYIARNTVNPEEIQTLLDLADSELRRVAVITNQTLRFHRQSSSPADVTCSQLFENVLNMYEGKLRNARITVEKRKRATQSVRIYEGDIRQVMNNIIGNAVDAMPRGGRLTIRSRTSTHWPTGRAGLTLTIADTGIGMPPDVAARVFEAFYTTKGINGSGLGLWISRDIVDRHKGALRVRTSQNPAHRGTVVTLFLPFQADISSSSSSQSNLPALAL